MVLNVTLSSYGLLPTNMSQELFLPRTILLAVFGKEFFLGNPFSRNFRPRKIFLARLHSQGTNCPGEFILGAGFS